MCRASLSVLSPNLDQLNHNMMRVSATIAAPSTTETMTKPPIFQVSGRLEGLT